MTNFRFIDFVKTPTAKQMGVVYVGLQTAIGEIMLGFKVVEKKDGSGYFFGEPTWKFDERGIEEWKPWIMIDSNIAKDQLFSFLRENVNRCLHKGNGTQQQQQQPQNQWQQQKQSQPQSGQMQQEETLFSGQPNDNDVPF